MMMTTKSTLSDNLNSQGTQKGKRGICKLARKCHQTNSTAVLEKYSSLVQDARNSVFTVVIFLRSLLDYCQASIAGKPLEKSAVIEPY